MAVSFLLLGPYTPNLRISQNLIYTLWLCGSIVANPIIYRLVPSPSRFEIRQWLMMSYTQPNITKVYKWSFARKLKLQTEHGEWCGTSKWFNSPQESWVTLQIGASRFCSEKGKKLLRNMPKKCSKVAQIWKKLLKNFVKLLEYFKTACLILITIVFGILILSTSFVLTTVHNYFPLSGNRILFRFHERSSPANCSFNEVYDYFVFERQHGVHHFALHTVRFPNLVPRAFLGSK